MAVRISSLHYEAFIVAAVMGILEHVTRVVDNARLVAHLTSNMLRLLNRGHLCVMLQQSRIVITLFRVPRFSLLLELDRLLVRVGIPAIWLANTLN